MYITTFYSFKGGVGRTMSLVNVGFELAKRGRKVLLVDFDLEAPGITTYPEFSHSRNSAGIIEYVSDYLDKFEAPPVEKYIYQCQLPVGETEAHASVWLMPSGKRDESYASRLNSIDWLKLYEERDGYLLFEDLKQQWAMCHSKFDYVLIDSRTGHTDVGGICTRQLPDSVVFLFFPNEQNISGLEEVVEEVRAENVRTHRNIKTLFCPSNVPNLDDENEILKRQLDASERRLKYVGPASVIHRYDSLALLDQVIFANSRPRSRLAEEYRTLAASIVRGNIEDKEGALAELVDIRATLRMQQRRLNVSVSGVPENTPVITYVNQKIGEIRKYHPHDGEVAWSLSSVFNALGDVQGEIEALTQAIDQEFRANDAYIARANCFLVLQQKFDAAKDLLSVLSTRSASALNVMNAIEALRHLDVRWIETIRTSQAIKELDPNEQISIAHLLLADDESLSIAAEIGQRILDKNISSELTGRACVVLSLSLIGLGEFEKATDVISSIEPNIMMSHSITNVFNYAMAKWGIHKEPDARLLNRVKELVDQVRYDFDANFAQCIALVYAALGDKDDAQSFLRIAKELLSPGPSFSCWRYRRVDRRQMSLDLDMLGSMIDGGAVLPIFLKAPGPARSH